MAKKKGEKYECPECGLVIVIADDGCECTECDVVCCTVPMELIVEKPKKQTAKKASTKSKPKTKPKTKPKKKATKKK